MKIRIAKLTGFLLAGLVAFTSVPTTAFALESNDENQIEEIEELQETEVLADENQDTENMPEDSEETKDSEDENEGEQVEEIEVEEETEEAQVEESEEPLMEYVLEDDEYAPDLLGVAAPDEITELSSADKSGANYTYTASTHTLELDGYSGYGFSCKSSTLNIVLAGNNELRGMWGQPALYAGGGMSISGSGRLATHGDEIVSEGNIIITGGTIVDCNIKSNTGGVNISGESTVVRVDKIKNAKTTTISGGKVVADSITNPYVYAGEVYITSANSLAAEKLYVEDGYVNVTESSVGSYKTSLEYPIVGDVEIRGGKVEISAAYGVRNLVVKGGDIKIAAVNRAVCKTATTAKGLILEAGPSVAKAKIVTQIGAEKYVKVWQGFRIDFDTKDGLNKVASQAVKYGETVDEPVEVIPPTGHRLKGWYRSRPGNPSNKWEFGADLVNSNMILYAVWEPIVYTVTFDPDTLNGGFVDETSRGVTYKTKYGDQGDPKALVDLPVPTKPECEFVGWYTKKVGGTLVTKDTVLTNPVDQTLYARWETKKYNVTLELDGGMIRSSEEVIVKVPSGERLIAQPDYAEPVKAGGVFEVWENDRGEVFDITNPITSDLTIHAKYRLSDGVAAPTFSVPSGEVVKGKKLYLESSTVGATIYYTTDGSDPLTSDTKIQYEDAIVINSDQTIRAVAKRYGFNSSSVVTATYTVRNESTYWGDVSDEDKAEFVDDANNVPKGLWVTGYAEHVPYTGSAVDFPSLRVYSYKKLLTKDTDYTVKITNNVNAGTGKIAVTGKGNYSGTINVAFTIDPIDFVAEDIEADDIFLMYNKKVQKGTTGVVLKQGGTEKVLKAGTDFYFNYNDATPGAYKEVGSYSIDIVGKGNYSGTATITEEITATPAMANLSIAKIANQACTGDEIKPDPVVKNGKVTLVKGVDYSVDYFNNKWPGTATIKLTGLGNYKGTRIVNFTITGKPINKAIFDKSLSANYNWNGESCEPVVDGTSESDPLASVKYQISNKVKISLRGKEKSAYEALPLEDKENIDYIYEYIGNTIDAGGVKIKFTGVNRYTGVANKTYKIVGKSMSNMAVKYKTSYTYTGEPCDPASEVFNFKVYQKKTNKTPEITLRPGDDYIVTYQSDAKTNNIKAGTATMIITGINGYTGTIKKTFKINPYNIATDVGNRITVNPISAEAYHKNGAKPEVVIEDSGRLLVNGVDYTLKYTNNTPKLQDKTSQDDEQKKPTVQIIGKGNYTGTITKTFEITKRDISEVNMTVSDVKYQKKANICKPTVSLVDTDGKALTNGTDYKNVKYYYQRDAKVMQIVNKNQISVIKRMGSPVASNDIIPAGTEIRATVEGTNNYEGTKYAVFRYVSSSINGATISVKNQVYDGDPVELTKDDITVKIGNTVLNKTDFDIVGFTNNTKKGTATVTIKGAGNYGGQKTVKYNIVAKSMNYKLVFDKNSSKATGTMKAAEISSGAAVPANNFKRTGYSFGGWMYDEDYPTKLIADKGIARFDRQRQPIGSTVTLKAKWIPVDYQIKYVLNGGVNDVSNPVTYNIEDTVTFEPPTREGYTFAGWYTNKNFASKYAITTINPGATGALTVYAKWVK